ncbi:MAG TPA: hypothetical protein VH643_35800 [Gemmataceae bacterium]
MRESATLPTAVPARDLHAEEEGMLSLASLFVVLGFLVLIGLLANAGTVTSRKLETQNAADAVAYSASVEMARGMNSITAINHLIGELTALVVLIHTLGGDELDQGKSPPSTPALLKTWLTTAYYAAKAIDFDATPQVDDGAYDEASPESDVGGAIYDARKRLKMVLAWAYQAHFFGDVIAKGQYIPIVGAILEGLGDSICAAAWVFEKKVWQECKILDALVTLAKQLQRVKVVMRDVLVPGLYYYEKFLIVPAAPLQAVNAANEMKTPNLADDVSLYPGWPVLNLNLPVQQEPDQVAVERSQLMRASTPWIQWWRQPWIDFGKDVLILSRFAQYFENRSTQYSLSIIKHLKQDKGIKLYVMSNPDPQGRGKTFEPWTFADQPSGDKGGYKGSKLADRMFCVVGLAHRRAPDAFGRNIFRYQENPDGMVCFAQAMLYNANPQKRGSGDKNWQPTVGWDTLNWNGPVPEYPGPVPAGDNTPTPTTPQPLIRLNWQSKLVPTTSERLTEAALLQPPGAIRNVLGSGRTNVLSELARTH